MNTPRLPIPFRAVENADVVAFAVQLSAQSAAEKLTDALAGKVLIDCTNPVKADLSGSPSGKLPAAEEIQSWAPGRTVVKAFNQIGFNIMADPLLEDRKAPYSSSPATSLQPIALWKVWRVSLVLKWWRCQASATLACSSHWRWSGFQWPINSATDVNLPSQ